MSEFENNQEQNNQEQNNIEETERQNQRGSFVHNHMGQRKPQNRGMWYLAMPLLLYLLISNIGSSIGALFILAITNPKLLVQMNQAGVEAFQSQELLNKWMLAVTDVIGKYMIELSIVTAIIAIPVFLFLYLRDTKIMIRDGMVWPKKEKIWKYIPIILFSAAACIGMNNLLTLSNLAEVSESYQQTSQSQYALQFQFQLIGFGLIVPIMEELLYRGLIYRRLRTFLYPRSAILWSALVFSLIHGNAVQMLYSFALGMALSYFYEHFHSIKAPILAHMIMNLTSVILTQYKIFAWQFAEPMRVGIVTVGCAFVGACMFVLIMNTTEENNHGPLIPSAKK